MFADAQVVVLVLTKLKRKKLLKPKYFSLRQYLNHISVELQLQFMVLLIFKESHRDLLGNDLSSEN